MAVWASHSARQAARINSLTTDPTLSPDSTPWPLLLRRGARLKMSPAPTTTIPSTSTAVRTLTRMSRRQSASKHMCRLRQSAASPAVRSKSSGKANCVGSCSAGGGAWREMGRGDGVRLLSTRPRPPCPSPPPSSCRSRVTPHLPSEEDGRHRHETVPHLASPRVRQETRHLLIHPHDEPLEASAAKADAPPHARARRSAHAFLGAEVLEGGLQHLLHLGVFRDGVERLRPVDTGLCPSLARDTGQGGDV